MEHQTLERSIRRKEEKIARVGPMWNLAYRKETLEYFLFVGYIISMCHFKTTYSRYCRIGKHFVEHQIRKRFMQIRLVSTSWAIEFTTFEKITIQASLNIRYIISL